MVSGFESPSETSETNTTVGTPQLSASSVTTRSSVKPTAVRPTTSPSSIRRKKTLRGEKKEKNGKTKKDFYESS